MPAIHVRNVPESTFIALRERARRHGHSMQEEIRLILAAAASERPSGQVAPPLELVMANTSSTTSWRREDIYGDDGR
jgi:plasmid stability protein